MFLRQSTAQTIRFGPFVDSTDGVTAETGLTIAQADMQLSKDGGAFAQKSAAGNATHDADGWYSTSLSTTDTATVGELYMQVTVSGALPVWVRYWVLEEVVYDDVYGASAAGPAVAGDAMDLVTDAVDSTSVATGAIDADAIASDAITAAKIAADAIGSSEFAQAAADKIWSSATRLLTAGTNIALAKGTGVTGFNDLSASQVNDEVVDVLSTDTHAEPASVPAATSSLKDKIGWLFALNRNKVTQTSTTQTLRNDADAADIASSTVSDDGTTFTRGEFS